MFKNSGSILKRLACPRWSAGAYSCKYGTERWRVQNYARWLNKGARTTRENQSLTWKTDAFRHRRTRKVFERRIHLHVWRKASQSSHRHFQSDRQSGHSDDSHVRSDRSHRQGLRNLAQHVARLLRKLQDSTQRVWLNLPLGSPQVKQRNERQCHIIWNRRTGTLQQRSKLLSGKITVQTKTNRQKKQRQKYFCSWEVWSCDSKDIV